MHFGVLEKVLCISIYISVLQLQLSWVPVVQGVKNSSSIDSHTGRKTGTIPVLHKLPL